MAKSNGGSWLQLVVKDRNELISMHVDLTLLGNYAIHSYLNAVLRKSIRQKNIIIPLLIVLGGKKGVTQFFPLVDPGKLCFGIWRPQKERGKGDVGFYWSTSRMPLTGVVNGTVFGFQEPILQGNTPVNRDPLRKVLQCRCKQSTVRAYGRAQLGEEARPEKTLVRSYVKDIWKHQGETALEGEKGILAREKTLWDGPPATMRTQLMWAGGKIDKVNGTKLDSCMICWVRVFIL